MAVKQEEEQKKKKKKKGGRRRRRPLRRFSSVLVSPRLVVAVVEWLKKIPEDD